MKRKEFMLKFNRAYAFKVMQPDHEETAKRLFSEGKRMLVEAQNQGNNLKLNLPIKKITLAWNDF